MTIKKKKLLSWLLLICFMFMSLLPSTAFAKEEAPTSPSISKFYFLGDSRTVGLESVSSDSSNIFKAAVSAGYPHMMSKIREVENQIKEGCAVAFLYGVNDLNNVNNYLNAINAAGERWSKKGAKVYFVSVGPRGNGSYNHVTQNAITQFNNTMKSGLLSSVGYIDLNGYLMKNGYHTDDGIHYDVATSKKILSYVRSAMKNGGSSQGSGEKEKHERNKESDEKVRDLAPPEGTSANAFSPDTNETKAHYQTSYAWDYNKAKVRYWESENGTEFERQAGWQEEFLEDNIGTTKEYLDLGSNGGKHNKSKDGDDVARIALAEVGKEDSIESPLGSDNVKYNTWYYGEEIDDGKHPWSGVFVSWCMNKADLIKSGFWKKIADVAEMFNYCTKDMGYKAYNTNATVPFGGNSYTPKLGDLMFFKKDGTWSTVGIVTAVNNDGIEIVMGDVEDKVQQLSYSKSDMDAIKDTMIVSISYPAGEYGDGSVEQNKDTIFRFLTQEMGYNEAAACGVLANIEGESGFVIKAEENPNGTGGYGLCQWTGDRRAALKNWCNSNNLDYQTLNGQLQFLKYETENKYGSVHSYLKGVSNSSEGAGKAAWYWCVHWEAPADTYGDAAERKGWAISKYWPRYGN